MPNSNILNLSFVYALITGFSISYLIHQITKIGNKGSRILLFILLFIQNYVYYLFSDYNNAIFLFLNFLATTHLFIFNPNKNIPAFLTTVMIVVLPSALTNFTFVYGEYFVGLSSFIQTTLNLQEHSYLFFIECIYRIIMSLALLFIYNSPIYKKMSLSMINGILMIVLALATFASAGKLFFTSNHLSLLIIIIILFIAILALVMDYYQTLQKDKDKENQLLENQLKLEKSELIYKNYLNEHQKLSTLKHSLLSELKNVSDDSKIKDYFEVIDKLITPVIHYYSRHSIINMILIEKALMFQQEKINYEFLILDDLLFLSEYEASLFFGVIIDQLLEDKDVQQITIKTTKDSSSFYTISYSINGNHYPELEKIWNNDIYKEIIDKYHIIDTWYEKEELITYSINLAYKE